MNMPFSVAPAQVMKDRAAYAKKGIARGRALVAIRYEGGVAMIAENSSTTLRKVSEIYDRIAFAGAGRYNAYDQLRVAGVRAADLKGFQYSRDDVDARSLANQYAQILGQIFTHEMKPMEVEILVAEVGFEPSGDQMFHVNYDGTVVDEDDTCVLGGDTAAITARLISACGDLPADQCELASAVNAAVVALSGADRSIPPDQLEVAVLERGGSRRCFRRLDDVAVAELLNVAPTG
ncbi:proteasome subunit alpha [soil metagenome]